MSSDEGEGQPGLARRVLVIVSWVLATVAGLAVLAGFGWLWWHSVPVLYEGYNGVSQAERLTAITSTRAALLAGLLGIGLRLSSRLTTRRA